MEQNQGSLIWPLWGSLQWNWCLIKPLASAPSGPALPWPLPSVGAVEVHRTPTLYYKLPVLELPPVFTTVCVLLTLLIHRIHTSYTHTGMLTTHAQLCSEMVKGTKSAKERKDRSSDQGQASNLDLSPQTNQEKYQMMPQKWFIYPITWNLVLKAANTNQNRKYFSNGLVCYHCFNFLSAPESHLASSSGCYSAPHHRVLTTENVLSVLCVPPILSLRWWIWLSTRCLSFKQIHIRVIERAGALVG